MRRSSALVVVAGNVFMGALATALTYFYAVTPRTLDAGSTGRGWPVAWMIDWWSSWTVPPSSGSIFDPRAFLFDLLFWLAVLLVPEALLLHKNNERFPKSSRQRSHATNYVDCVLGTQLRHQSRR
jgi:hypothetical protein